MLYERWQLIAKNHPGEIALRDVAANRCWTFAELNSASEQCPTDSEPVSFPKGIGAQFILETLSAWRHGKICCPLDAGQERPVITSQPRNCAHLKLTSATTGASRLITFTAEQLAADADNIVSTMGLRPDWPNIGVISIAHSYGFSNLVLPLLLHGIPLTLLDSPLPAALDRATRLHQFVTLPAVPALWRTWHEAKVLPANLRLAISAGAPLPLALESSIFETSGIKVHNFYGSSECGGIAYDRSTQPRNDAACVGSPMDGVSVTVTDAGCLEVRGHAVATSYWPISTDTLGVGRFETSDLAELKDGQIYLRGRASDLINVAGRKVSPETIERTLAQHPEVRECLVFGVPDSTSERTEIIVACVAANSPTNAAALRQFLLHQLPAWQIPREWVLLPEIPVNQRGKLSRAAWRENYLAGKLA